ncbi:uncharacterized protein At4g17910 [Drosophila subobscura]|uniref:uncharacterized protein At4g17910 n=1 Tax=Drosophila subobscura TaxID=7241 RepID=UPI00155AF650|nr:uncharacterized protein At4g17910 [Drosophila subobscura]
MTSQAIAVPGAGASIPAPMENSSANSGNGNLEIGSDAWLQQVVVYDWQPAEILGQNVESMQLIVATFWCVLVARVATQKLCPRSSPSVGYAVEFLLIVPPVVLLATVASDYCTHILLLMLICSLWFLFRSQALQRACARSQFDLGGTRPTVFTLVRALTHLITAVCILAIDFQSFHRPYRKSRTFGAKLMDTGIGLFVVTMGLVSHRTRHTKDLRRSLVYAALPLLLLGLARTVALLIVGYGQDEHEYGRDMNAFFTLGLTKLFGSLASLLARRDVHLLPLGLGLLVVHQMGLSVFGFSDYVMDEDVPRETLFSANREGLVSLPGFVAMYLLSIFLSRWLMSATLLSYSEMVKKLRRLLLLVLILWSLFAASAFAIGISRVTCNFGYVVWTLSIICTIMWLGLFGVDFVIDSVLPWDAHGQAVDSQEKGQLLESAEGEGQASARIGSFAICQSLNLNGLTFFLLANLLTGGVNIFLKPEDRSQAESVLILLAYMFLATKAVHVLLQRGVRLA